MALDLLSVAKLVDITAVSTSLAKNGTFAGGAVWPAAMLVCDKTATNEVKASAIRRRRQGLVQNSLE